MEAEARAHLARLLELAKTSGSPLLIAVAQCQQALLMRDARRETISTTALNALAESSNWHVAGLAMWVQIGRALGSRREEGLAERVERLAAAPLPREAIAGQSVEVRMRLTLEDHERAFSLADETLARLEHAPCLPSVAFRLEKHRIDAGRACGRLRPSHMQSAIERVERLVEGLDESRRERVLTSPLISKLCAVCELPMVSGVPTTLDLDESSSGDG